MAYVENYPMFIRVVVADAGRVKSRDIHEVSAKRDHTWPTRTLTTCNYMSWIICQKNTQIPSWLAVLCSHGKIIDDDYYTGLYVLSPLQVNCLRYVFWNFHARRLIKSNNCLKYEIKFLSLELSSIKTSWRKGYSQCTSCSCGVLQVSISVLSLHLWCSWLVSRRFEQRLIPSDIALHMLAIDSSDVVEEKSSQNHGGICGGWQASRIVVFIFPVACQGVFWIRILRITYWPFWHRI